MLVGVRCSTYSMHSTGYLLRKTNPLNMTSCFEKASFAHGRGLKILHHRGGDLVIRQRFHQVTKKSINTQPFAMLSKILVVSWFFILWWGGHIERGERKKKSFSFSCGHPKSIGRGMRTLVLLKRWTTIVLLTRKSHWNKLQQLLLVFFCRLSRYMCDMSIVANRFLSFDPHTEKKSYLWQATVLSIVTKMNL